MTRDHHYRRCRPALVRPEGADPAETEAWSAAANRAWAATNDRGKQLFHEFQCLDRRNPEHVMFMSVITKRIRDQFIADAQRHRRNAGQVLDFMDKAGVKTLTPQPGQTIRVACTRVADSMRLGDDPYPALAARRQITTCVCCEENVFIDPYSYGPADPEPVCMRCLDPEISAEIDRLIDIAEKKEADASG